MFILKAETSVHWWLILKIPFLICHSFFFFPQALYIADRKARESVEARAQLEKKIAAKEKEAKENKLADLARKAREERAGFRSKESDGFDQFLGEAKKASSSKGKWYFVSKIFITYCEKKLFYWLRKNFWNLRLKAENLHNILNH